jgi:hypothetical protein
LRMVSSSCSPTRNRLNAPIVASFVDVSTEKNMMCYKLFGAD